MIVGCSAKLLVLFLHTTSFLYVSSTYEDTVESRSQESEYHDTVQKPHGYSRHRKTFYDVDLGSEDDQSNNYHNHKLNHNRRHYKNTFRHCTTEKDCICSCQNCVSPEPCCEAICASCPTQSSLIFVPYAYPVIIKDTTPETTTEPQTTTAPETTTAPPTTTPPQTTTAPQTTTVPQTTTAPTTKAPPPKTTKKKILLHYSESSRSKKLKQKKFVQLDSLIKRIKALESVMNGRPESNKLQNKVAKPAVTKPRPSWAPKYGIVPIPNNMAEELITQLRAFKDSKKKPKGK